MDSKHAFYFNGNDMVGATHYFLLLYVGCCALLAGCIVFSRGNMQDANRALLPVRKIVCTIRVKHAACVCSVPTH